MLRTEDLSAWYGEARVLADVALEVQSGQIVTLVGRNGAGKTTMLRCLMGLHPQTRGRILLDGEDLSRLPAHQRARRGGGCVPADPGLRPGRVGEGKPLLPP